MNNSLGGRGCQCSIIGANQSELGVEPRHRSSGSVAEQDLFHRIIHRVAGDMRFSSFSRILLLLVSISFAVPLSGCGKDMTESEGPELGAVEAYLQEHPEEREENPEDVESEEDENAAAS
ncbi:hypothetical protein [Stieleria sp.]|uniref:hypothetical protein n=1 Tax=Stieleria sp. TaxID=2795976 RepID=UPI0035671A6C